MNNNPLKKTEKPLNARSHSLYENPLALWRTRHLEAFHLSLSRFKQHPVAMGMTVAVIGMALAFPLLLWVFLKNIEVVSHQWQASTQISLFLKPNLAIDDINGLVEGLARDTDIASVKYISPTEGLASFEQASGMSNLSEILPSNPLPPVIELHPATKMQSPLAIQSLQKELQQLPEVDVVQLDMAWVKRLYSILTIAKKMVWGVGLLLSFAVVLIIANTIRLATENNHREIEVMRLVGAPHAYIRRPFLYTGALYGCLGGLVAWLLVEMIAVILAQPVKTLALSYGSSFHLLGLGFMGTLATWGLSAGLGLLGAWAVLEYYLRISKGFSDVR